MTSHPLVPHLTMQCSHRHWLNPGHSFSFAQICAWEAFSSLADVPFGVIILCRSIGDTACCCGRAEVRVPATSGCKSSPERVIHYSLSAHAQFQKWPWKPVRPKLDQPDRLLRPCISVAGSYRWSVYSLSPVDMVDSTSTIDDMLHDHVNGTMFM